VRSTSTEQTQDGTTTWSIWKIGMKWWGKSSIEYKWNHRGWRGSGWTSDCFRREKLAMRDKECFEWTWGGMSFLIVRDTCGDYLSSLRSQSSCLPNRQRSRKEEKELTDLWNRLLAVEDGIAKWMLKSQPQLIGFASATISHLWNAFGLIHSRCLLTRMPERWWKSWVDFSLFEKAHWLP
jgi:hypothetical protein